MRQEDAKRRKRIRKLKDEIATIESQIAFKPQRETKKPTDEVRAGDDPLKPL